ncbi:MAG: ABC transporter substrate-binding protein [Gemmataceae bacterium]|nr:ABC transporter substrate-binding protein [Gemmataceae bacterium]
MSTCWGRRKFLQRLAAGALLLPGCRQSGGRLVVGFSQMDTGGAWRVAETRSMREAAAARGDRFRLLVTDAQDQTAKQLADVEDMIARRVTALFVAPREYEGLETVFAAARRVGIPVFLLDREAREPGTDYLTFIGSDFVAQGRQVAQWLVRHTGGQAAVVELTGTPGSSVARDRAAGFREGIAAAPGMRILAAQTASFSRAAGQRVMSNLVQAFGPRLTAVYAHNDEMALGAVQALRAAARRPGRDVTVVSVDGQRAALEAILRGELGATVESDPRLGPPAFAALEDHLSGKPVPPRLLLTDRLFDASNAARFIGQAY